MSEKIKDELAEFLKGQFSLVCDELKSDEIIDPIQWLEKQLATRILFFIRTDMDKLLQILYRIDIDQRQTDRAFAMGEVNKVAATLAKLIVERQVQKIQYRKLQYGQNKK